MSTDGFSKIAVIGAGTMGSGIAAQIANAGHEVTLLDLPAREAAAKSPAKGATTAGMLGMAVISPKATLPKASNPKLVASAPGVRGKAVSN